MKYGEMSLEQLGSHAFAHYKAGEKANQKANDHAKSSGLYLAEAKRRIDVDIPYGQRTDAWTKFLADHCPLKRTRAEQLIAVATGKTTEVEVQEKNAAANREHRERVKASLSSRDDKVQHGLPPPTPTNPEDIERADTIARITAKLANLSIDQLRAVERIIPRAVPASIRMAA